VKIDNITAEVRPRISWESVDLGFTMVRSWWRPVFVPWLYVMLPLAILVNVLLWQHPWWALFVLWWLKPLYDRIPLHVLSRALFGATPSTRETLRALPGLFRFHVIKALTIHRFDPARSFNLPVWQLEHTSGKQRHQRLRVLHKTMHNSAVWLTVACLLFIVIVAIGLFALALLMVPESLAEEMWYQVTEDRSAWWLAPVSNGFLTAATLLIEPFYVAGGFALYLNRRSHLEGWDIELTFRRLATRIRESRGRAAASIVVLLAASLLFGAVHQVSHADSAVMSRQEAQTIIEEVFQQPEFNTKREVSGWFPINPSKEEEKQDDEEESSDWSNFFSFVKSLFGAGEAVATLLELLLWLLAAVVIGLFIFYFSKWRPDFGGRRRLRKRDKPPTALFGMDLRPESLPEDIADEAWSLWQAGNRIEAMSLLYRGALVTLVHQHGLKLASSATEGDCVRAVRKSNETVIAETADYFASLTGVWQTAAYAHRLPDTRIAQELCQRWPQHFGAAP
jgi:hypothetical protein